MADAGGPTADTPVQFLGGGTPHVALVGWRLVLPAFVAAAAWLLGFAFGRPIWWSSVAHRSEAPAYWLNDRGDIVQSGGNRLELPRDAASAPIRSGQLVLAHGRAAYWLPHASIVLVADSDGAATEIRPDKPIGSADLVGLVEGRWITSAPPSAMRRRGEPAQLATVDPATGHVVVLPTQTYGRCWPHGDGVAVVSWQGGVVSVDITGAERGTIWHGRPGCVPVGVSSNSDTVVYWSTSDDSWHVESRGRLRGTLPMPIGCRVGGPVWVAPDGRTVYYSSSYGPTVLSYVWRLDVETGRAAAVGHDRHGVAMPLGPVDNGYLTALATLCLGPVGHK